MPEVPRLVRGAREGRQVGIVLVAAGDAEADVAPLPAVEHPGTDRFFPEGIFPGKLEPYIQAEVLRKIEHAGQSLHCYASIFPEQPMDLQPTIEQPEPDYHAPEHRVFYMQMRRSLRGHQTAEGMYTGPKMHKPAYDVYFNICDEDALFHDDNEAASMPIDARRRKSTKRTRHDTVHEDIGTDNAAVEPMDFEDMLIPPVQGKSSSHCMPMPALDMDDP